MAALLLVWLIIQGQHFFNRRAIRQEQSLINSFGNFSALAVIFLMLISTAIPPLPLPIPLIEITSGLVFGFWGGFILVWASQILSSTLAFFMARYFGKRLFGGILKSHIWDYYRKLLARRGKLAVFIIRATLAAPFNVISFLSGLTEMKPLGFIGATALGTLPEAILFSLIGAQLKNVHIRLWYLFIAITILGSLGTLGTFLLLRSSSKKSPVV